jgi:hypothetical protein
MGFGDIAWSFQVHDLPCYGCGYLGSRGFYPLLSYSVQYVMKLSDYSFMHWYKISSFQYTSWPELYALGNKGKFDRARD